MSDTREREKEEPRFQQWIVPFVEEDLRNCLKSTTKVSLWLKAHLKLFGKIKDTRNTSSSLQNGKNVKDPSEDFAYAVLSTKLSDLKT